MSFSEVEYLKSDLEKLEFLQNMLVARATGGDADESHYKNIRQHFMNSPVFSGLSPSWLKTNRDLSQFWQFIKIKYPTYQERRIFIYSELSPLFEFLESKSGFPPEKYISDSLSQFDSSGVHHAWTKALERKNTDPDGAITIARSILESVCKHILDRKGVSYATSSIMMLPEN